ncbi:cupin domain-containing protein [Duganella aceris]|uniref:Cupin domain-containing protein n=1 Tax=Duganella aceris TaxID=2703883 RepID=A0ABX0FLB0_9BURK|nr:cupin domain-containing protein [Duganella aceris]NGZ85319.1 cupin domain-containing protein [Duganella aceris]
MFRLSRLLCVLLLAAGGAQAQNHAHEVPSKKIVTELMTKALPDMPGKEVLMLTVVYPPAGDDEIHRHDAHGFVYVLEGEIVMGVKGGKEQTLGPGQIFYEGPTDIHTVGRNASKTKPAKFVVFLLKDQNKPPVIPVAK